MSEPVDERSSQALAEAWPAESKAALGRAHAVLGELGRSAWRLPLADWKAAVVIGDGV